jgi:hypothetical protein
MLLRDWVDVAWAKILRDVPTMASPFEYRQKMHAAFWEGKYEGSKESATDAVAHAKEAVGKAAPTAAVSEMEALRARARAMRAEQANTTE